MASTSGDDPGWSSMPNSSLMVTGIGDLAARATFLALFIVLGVVGNCVLVAIITLSHRLKSVTLNLFIINCCATNLVDCLVNMPVVLGASIREHWDYGSVICKLNACLTQLVTINMAFGLFLMTLDRFMGVKFMQNSKLSLTKVRGLIAYGWVHSIAFSVPLLVNSSVEATPYPARYSCSVEKGAPLLYVVFTSLLGFLIPILVTIGFFVYIIGIGICEHLRKRRTQHSYEDNVPERDRMHLELSASKYVGMVFVTWTVLQCPYLVLTCVEQYRTTTEIEETVPLDIDYPWEMELAFTWMRFSNAMLLPFITFCWMKEVWQRFKNFILCRKSNLIVDVSPSGTPNRQSEEVKEQADLETSMSVPVIFATEEGLHFQTMTRKGRDLSEYAVTDGYQYSEINVSQVLTSRKCDIYGSQDFVQIREDEDTSDYDSHGDLDPLSASNGLSVASGEMDNAAFDSNDMEDSSQCAVDVKTEKSERPEECGLKDRESVRSKRDTDSVRNRGDTDSGHGSLQERQRQKELPTEAPQKTKKRRRKKPLSVDEDAPRSANIKNIRAKPMPNPATQDNSSSKARERRRRIKELAETEDKHRGHDSGRCYAIGPEIEDVERENMKQKRKKQEASLNYKSMHILTAKAVSETVHIAPKTPDSTVDSLQYSSAKTTLADQ